jgi:hypothetical protein
MSGTGIKGKQIADGTVEGVDIDWDPHLEMQGHIIPDTNAAYDLGNATYKIRHLFLSDTSLWVGDNHKVDVDSSGKKKHRKRKKSSPPKSLRGLRIANLRQGTPLVGGDDAAKDLEIEAEVVAMFAGVPFPPNTSADVTLAQWIQYAQSIDGHGDPASLTVGDIFNPEEEDDWEEIIEDRPSMSAVVLTSPNGTRYLLTVSDAGVLSVDAE